MREGTADQAGGDTRPDESWRGEKYQPVPPLHRARWGEKDRKWGDRYAIPCPRPGGEVSHSTKKTLYYLPLDCDTYPPIDAAGLPRRWSLAL